LKLEKIKGQFINEKEEGLLLKLSGEVFSHLEVLDGIVGEIADLIGKVRFAVLVGGGNHVRGAGSGRSGEDRVFTDRMGMIGTLLNGLRLESMLHDAGIYAVHMSAVPIAWVRRYDPVGARNTFCDRKLLILSGGVGLPYFSTDTAAVLRAIEIGAKRVLKGTKVKGVYSDDPERNPDACFFEELSYAEVLAQNLAVMDQTAFSLAREYDLIIQVFDVFSPGNIGRLVRGQRVGTVVKRGVGA